MIFRAGYNDPQIEFVAINDLGGPDQCRYYLQYDTTQGTFDHVETDENHLIIGDKRIQVLQERDINKLPWRD